MAVQHWFLHIDLDAFFASVEQLDNPSYKGKPVIVGGMPGEKRSVVSTASYEARVYGVHSAMPVFQAYKLCPQGIYVHPRMHRYSELSYQIMTIFQDYSPDVQQMSIDEAFLDITGTEGLFGPPEQTAMKIKERIKKETGLTVSIGLAPTKYLAKIASDMNKPDGFYMIQPGTEEKFMLSIPIKKVFGIGKKTIEKLKQSGITTTQDIHNQSLEVLNFMFGPNQGNFLYHTVRGLEIETFSTKPKSHSISSETTFYEDITDLYTIETKLLEICHAVFFRLLKDKCFSKTIMIKIRYEDFSTVSIQKTYDKNVLIIDDLYTKAKSLLEEKIIPGRGVRLLGLGLENITTEEKDVQLELFDDGTEKKQALEKAILNLEQIHPEIKIHKARILEQDSIYTRPGKRKNSPDFTKIKNILVFLFLGFSLFWFGNTKAYSSENDYAASVASDTLKPEVENIELDKLFFQWKNPLQPVDFELSGFWKMNLTGSLISSFGYGNPFALSLSTPVFKQEVDFYTIAKITPHWYFKLNFLDNFNTNTYTLGYENSNSYFNSFIFSNRGITFPTVYSSQDLGYSVGGGQTQSPGVSLVFRDYEKNRWNSNFIFRYDLTKIKDATFYGSNYVNETNIYLENYTGGKFFVIPDSYALKSIKDIYVESAKGTERDENGFKYRKLNSTEYSIILDKNLLIIGSTLEQTKDANICISFTDETAFNSFITAAGNYNLPESFLGKIQQYFNSGSDKKIDLSKFSYNISTKIQNENCILVKAGTYFSPFESSQFYDLGISTGNSYECFIISKNSQIQLSDYIIEPDYFEALGNISGPLFKENHSYGAIFSKNLNYDSYLDPAYRFPLGNLYPEIYLLKKNPSDYLISRRTYTPVSFFDIGRQAAEGTVKVYINGILDSLATYDSNSGFVSLSKNVSQLDKIYITWQEESSGFSNGAFVTAGGLDYTFSPLWNIKFNIAARIPFTPEIKYSDNEFLSNGYIFFGEKTIFTANNLEISDNLGFAVENPDMSGAYLTSTNTKEDVTNYLGINNGYTTHQVPDLSVRFPFVNLTETNNHTLPDYTGKNDIEITGYKIPIGFDFTSTDSNETVWASADIKLTQGAALYKSSQMEIAIKPESNLENFDIYLQLGNKAEDEFSGEHKSDLPVWKISDSTDAKVAIPLDTGKTQWQIVRINLNDSDRSKLINNYDCRIILVKENYDMAHDTVKGILSVGPYKILSENFYVFSTDDYNCVTYAETENDSFFYRNYSKENNSAGKIQWQKISDSKTELFPDEDSIISAVTYFPQRDISNYKYVNLDFLLENTDFSFELLLDSDDETDSSSAPALKLDISSDYLQSVSTFEWHKLSVDVQNKKLFINNLPVSDEYYSVSVNPFIVPHREAVSFHMSESNSVGSKGSVILGNLYFTESVPFVQGKNKIDISYKNKETVWSIKNLKILKDVNFQLQSIQTGTINNQTSEPSGNISFSQNSGFNLLSLNFASNLYGEINSKETIVPDKIINTASHKISTGKSIFPIFAFDESYKYNPKEKNSEKINNFITDFSSLHLPLKLQFNTNSKILNENKNQSEKGVLSFNSKIKKTQISLNMSGELSQKINQINTISNNYFNEWLTNSIFEFSTGEISALYRKIDLKNAITVKLSFAQISPEINWNLSGKYENINFPQFQDSTVLSFKLPFAAGKNNFGFVIQRTAAILSNSSSEGNYNSDFDALWQNQSKHIWLYKEIPFVDLFDKTLAQKIQDSGNSFNTKDNAYSSSYELHWKRAITSSLYDFFLPQSSNISLSREINTTATISDFYQIKGNFTSMSVNLFGAESKKKLFKFYNQDEFTSSLTSTIKIPSEKPNDTIYQIAAYNSAVFFMKNKSTVKIGFDMSVDSNSDWLLRSTLIWNTPGKYSPLIIIPKFFIKGINEKNTKVTRKELFNFSAGETKSLYNMKIELNHNCDVQFMKNYTISAGAGMSFTMNEQKVLRLSLDYSVGAQISF